MVNKFLMQYHLWRAKILAKHNSRRSIQLQGLNAKNYYKPIQIYMLQIGTAS